MRNVLEVIELDQVTEFDATFGSNTLMLVIEVFAPLGKTDGGKSFCAEGAMISAPKIAIEAQFHYRFKRLEMAGFCGRGKGRKVYAADGEDFAGKLARRRIVFHAKGELLRDGFCRG